MPQNVADLQKQMARGREKADTRQFYEDHFKGIDRIIALERSNQDIPKPRPNKEFINGKGANDVMAFTGQLKRDARIEETGEEAARKVNASRSAAQNASGRPPKKTPSPAAKPVSAYKGTQMISAMTAKPKLASDAAKNALFHKNRRNGDAAQYMRDLQFGMDDAKAAAEWRAEDKREKSPASIQKGMAASTRKTQAASAAARRPASNGTFKGGSPRSSMSKNLKIK